ncbi:MAG: hypothetical protein IT303_09810 [Dehalococcoidia bacterium]|nr:hypothetical protein [Dehalococcoidia bacterium]
MTVPPVIEAVFAHANRLTRFWDENYEQLLVRYPDQFVAAHVDTGEVIAANPDLVMLMYDLRDRGIELRDNIGIEYISTRAGAAQL